MEITADINFVIIAMSFDSLNLAALVEVKGSNVMVAARALL